ncbi:MAG: DUF3553 domain-containing protein [Alphaproteobacteria bacterium]|nr:DUF3553 domain-containing protein [Alphaproteobacteria bacterium]
MSLSFAPGAPSALVRHPDQPDWRLGMVQSTIGNRVTVNFAQVGKQTIDTENVALELISEDRSG